MGGLLVLSGLWGSRVAGFNGLNGLVLGDFQMDPVIVTTSLPHFSPEEYCVKPLDRSDRWTVQTVGPLYIYIFFKKRKIYTGEEYRSNRYGGWVDYLVYLVWGFNGLNGLVFCGFQMDPVIVSTSLPHFPQRKAQKIKPFRPFRPLDRWTVVILFFHFKRKRIYVVK